jgi:hypothetical protein
VLPALFLVLSSFAPQAQTGASRVILAAVTDLRGRPVVDVGADDFVVQEGSAARDVLSVRVADYPIVVLLDTGTDARADFESMQRAAARFIDRLGRDRPVIVGTFGGVPRLVAGFDDDRAAVLQHLNALAPVDGAGSQLLRGAAVAADALRATGALFSSVVILSGTAAEASPDAPEGVIGAVLASNARLHVISDRNGASDGSREAVLRNLIEQTHGEYTPIYSAASYQSALDRLADRLSSEMLIEYLVPPGSKPIDAKVGIRVPGTRVQGLGVAPK